MTTTRAIKILNIIAQTLYDRKGENILALNLNEISTMTDYVVIAEGNVDRHLKALASAVQDSLNLVGERALRIEGSGSDWIVIDYGDVIVHLFTSEQRENYALEELWREAQIVDLHIEIKRG